jgi:predicted permease
LNAFLQDLRHGIRLLARRPGLTAGLVLTLALGIGANASIFSVISAVLLHPLPMRDPARLAVLWAADRQHADQQVEVSFRDLTEWQRRSRTFESFAALSSVNLDIALTGGDRPQQIEGMMVSAGFFDVIGARALIGHVPTAAQAANNNAFTGVISHRLWQSRYAADPGIIGRAITADHSPVTIVGVMPPDFDFPHNVDFWYPVSSASLSGNLDIRIYRVIGHLAAGRTLQQGQQEMESIARALERELPQQHRGLGVRVDSLAQAVYGNARPALWMLMAAVGLLLLTACVNAGNLLLSRAMSRRNEMLLRAALGAGRPRVVRQLLTEALPVGLLAGLAGLLLARYGVAMLAALAPKDIPRIGDSAIGGNVILYSWLVTLATVVFFALPGALQATGTALTPRRNSRNRMRGAFVVVQVAVSVVLIAGAVTLGRGLVRLNRIDPGFQRDHILTFRITLSKPEHRTQQARQRFYQDLLERLRQIHGVHSAAAILLRPLSGTVGWDTNFALEGQSPQEQQANRDANYEAISPDYFRTMRIPLIAGRDFDNNDRASTEPVAIVSAALARRYFPQGAVGQRIRLASPAWLKIVGVAADTRYREWEKARFDIYIPFQQRAQHRSDFVVRTAQNPLALAGEIERAVASVDKDQPVSSLSTIDALVEETFALPRFNLTLVGAFAACAMLLAGTGLFALLMHTMTQRRQEIGLRMAIGARRADIVRLVVVDGMRLAAVGITAGAFASWGAMRTVAAYVAGMPGVTSGTLALAGGIVMAIAVASALIPATRAARIDPIQTLRHE